MHYKMREIEIPFETRKIIEFEANTLCKIVECTPVTLNTMNIVVLERWGEQKGPTRKYKIILLAAGDEFEYTVNYEPTLSRRGTITQYGKKYYVFQVG